MNKEVIESIVRDVLTNLEQDKKSSASSNNKKTGLTDKDYPLAKKRAELVKTPTGKQLDELEMQKFISGDLDGSELRITAETLYNQAEIAKSIGREQFAKNLERAAELTKIDDDRILEIYNAMRPYRSTKAELMEIADELENEYDAEINATFIREAAEVYEKRRRLKGDR